MYVSKPGVSHGRIFSFRFVILSHRGKRADVGNYISVQIAAKLRIAMMRIAILIACTIASDEGRNQRRIC